MRETENTMPPLKLLIFIPTFNEAENAERLCRELSALELRSGYRFLRRRLSRRDRCDCRSARD